MNKRNYPVFISVSVLLLTFSLAGCSKKMVKKERGIKSVSVSPVKNGEKEKGEIQPSRDEIQRMTGKYRLELPGYKGLLTINYNREEGKYYGEILFKGWGHDLPQPLKNLSIKNGKIYFVRSVKTVEELRKYGSSRYFTQKYYGKFSKDGSEIRGEFTDSGAVTNWRAGR